MINIPSDQIEEIISGAENGWSNALFSSISFRYPNLSFQEHKELFFELLRTLLDEKRVVFSVPLDQEVTEERLITRKATGSDGWTTIEDVAWGANSKSIIAYLCERWPADAKDEQDVRLIDFFYNSVPAISWRQVDGTYYGS